MQIQLWPNDPDCECERCTCHQSAPNEERECDCVECECEKCHEEEEDIE